MPAVINIYILGNITLLQRQEMLMQNKLEVQKKIEESVKHLEEINYKLALYELQKEEVRKNPNYNFKCHGLEMNFVKRETAILFTETCQEQGEIPEHYDIKGLSQFIHNSLVGLGWRLCLK